jgi:hypothetical protein
MLQAFALIKYKILLLLGYQSHKQYFEVLTFLIFPNYLSLKPSPEINTSGENITVWRLQVNLMMYFQHLTKANKNKCVVLTLVTSLLVSAIFQKRCFLVVNMKQLTVKFPGC